MSIDHKKVLEALDSFDRSCEFIGGCGDGGCVVFRPRSGMHTNGGCRCETRLDKIQIRRLLATMQRLRTHLAEAGYPWPERSATQPKR